MLINVGEVTLNTQWVIAAMYRDGELVVHLLHEGPSLKQTTLSFTGEDATKLHLTLKEVADMEMAHALVDSEYGVAITAKTNVELSAARKFERAVNTSLNDK